MCWPPTDWGPVKAAVCVSSGPLGVLRECKLGGISLGQWGPSSQVSQSQTPSLPSYSPLPSELDR